MKRPFTRLLALIGSIALGTAGALVLASPAQAHHTVIVPTANCAEDGWVITWKVENGQWGNSGNATIKEMDVTPSDSPITGFGVGTKIAKNASVSGTQNVPYSKGSARVQVKAKWDNGHTATNETEIKLNPAKCGEHEAGITAAAECNTDTGNWDVTWKVSNKHFLRKATAYVITSGSTKSAIKVGGNWQTINENLVVGLKDNDTIDAASTTTATQIVPGNATAARLHVRLTWDKDKWTEKDDDATDIVEFQGACVKKVPKPEVVFASDCSKTVTVTLKNKDGATKDAIFTITFNGVSTEYKVAPGTSTAVSIPSADAGAISVTAAEGMEPASYTWQDSAECHPLEIDQERTCTSLSVILNNPANGKESTVVLTPNIGDAVTKTVKAGESVTVTFEHQDGPLYVDVTVDQVAKDRITWTQPKGCAELEGKAVSTCLGVSVDINNPEDGSTKEIVLTPSYGDKVTFTLNPGESKHVDFKAPATGGLTVKATVNGEDQGTFTWVKPKDCPVLPKTGSNTSGIILWGSILVAVGALAVYMARRRLVHLRNLAR